LTLKSKGLIHFSEKNYSEALGAYKKALNSAPFDVDMLAASASCSYSLGDKKGAYKYAHEILDIDPDQAEAHNLVGLGYIELGRLKDAETEFRRALELNPTEKDYSRNLETVKKKGWSGWKNKH
jgi:tetratricopeptide (TPR) repeat protein